LIVLAKMPAFFVFVTVCGDCREIKNKERKGGKA
jgi:hypothetical protein